MNLAIARIFAFLGAFAIAMGAFGAHALEQKVSSQRLETWKTATFYLIVHVLAGLLSTVICKRPRSQKMFLTGIFFFSGSLFTLVLLDLPILGAVTPVGGVCFIFGWIFLALDIRASFKEILK